MGCVDEAVKRKITIGDVKRDENFIREEKTGQRGSRVWFYCQQCGKEHSVCKWSYDKAKNHFCSKSCTRTYYNVGERNPNWKGTEVHEGEGYLKIHIETGIEEKYHCMSNSDGYIKVHRYVMAKAIGRPLEDYEVVHHRNGDTEDNEISNLELMTAQEHNREHNKGERCRFHVLKEDEVLQIKLLLKEGVTHKCIANRYGVARETVTQINTGRSWGWLD